jgi:hypothetical protein
LIEPPEATDTFFPIKHAAVLESVRAALISCRLAIRRTEIVLARSGGRMVAILDIDRTLVSGVTLAVAVHNATDKSLRMGLSIGHRVWGCDNLGFCSAFGVKSRHTLNAPKRFQREMTDAVAALPSFEEYEQARIRRLQGHILADEPAEAIMLRAFEGGLATNHLLPDVIKEWRQPSFEQFQRRTSWSLLNAFAAAMRPRIRSNPADYERRILGVSALIDQNAAVTPFRWGATTNE